MSSFSVVYDACVLYPAPLRDLLMRLAMTDLYGARWTQQIHEEWMRNVLANRPEEVNMMGARFAKDAHHLGEERIHARPHVQGRRR